MNEVKEVATCDCKKIFRTDIEVISEGSDLDYWEKDEDMDELDKLGLQHYVVIWAIDDVLRPMVFSTLQ